MDNLSIQLEELETLNAIYQDEWKSSLITPNSYSIKIAPNIELFITLNDDYPTLPPKYELLAPVLNESHKKEITEQFDEIFKTACGGPILFQWIEKLKEIVEEAHINDTSVEPDSSIITEIKENPRKIDLNIIHGPIIEDRKSVFQGHAIAVHSPEETSMAMELLLQNKKIAQATHNISAYRIEQQNGSILQDCDDDGETHAGKRVLHLLQILELKNVMVVVTRWYGGVHLGPDRFKHINNSARQVLIEANFIQGNS